MNPDDRESPMAIAGGKAESVPESLSIVSVAIGVLLRTFWIAR